jgi:hypothetical protein
LRFDLDGRAMASTKAYREFAVECLRLAASAHTEEHRRMLLDIAKIWTTLALQPSDALRSPKQVHHPTETQPCSELMMPDAI